MPQFSGTLNTNEVYSAIYNMIISQKVFANPIADGYNLVDRAKVDGGLYGDTKLYYSTDVLESYAWSGDSEASNLLATKRAPAPYCQAIVLDQFRQILLTVDEYLSKRAWGNEGAFAQFNGVLVSWLKTTKDIYDQTTYNAFFGTAKSSEAAQNISVDLSGITPAATTSDNEAYNKLKAQTIAEAIADELSALKKPSRNHNDIKFMRSYSKDNLVIIWNSKFINEIEKVDLPAIFHDKDVFENLIKEENILHEDYFGDVNSGATAGDGSTVFSLIEQDINGTHVFAGELVPTGETAPAGTSYTKNGDIVCVITSKELPPYLSAFEVGTSFYNARALLTNRYLTWGHNTLERLSEHPFVRVSI